MLRQLISAGILLGLLSPASAAGQDDAAPPQVRMRRMPVTAEGVLRMRARLELSEDQIGQLSRIRVESLERRQAEMTRMLDLRSRLGAGDLTFDEFAAEMRKGREGRRERAAALGEQVTGVLTDAQRERFTTLRRQALRQRARMGALRNRRGGRGFAPGRGGRGEWGVGRGPRAGGGRGREIQGAGPRFRRFGGDLEGPPGSG